MGQPNDQQQQKKFGENIRIARENSKVSVRELARRVGVSASHISQVERGLASFSVPALYTVTSELGISMDSLFEDPTEPQDQTASEQERLAANGQVSLDEAGIVQRSGSRPILTLNSGPTWERLTARPEVGREFIEVVYAPASVGASPPNDLVTHSGREFGIITQGSLSVQVGFSFTVLAEGDSIAFDCTIPHRFWNATGETVRAVWFIAETANSNSSTADAEPHESLHAF